MIGDLLGALSDRRVELGLSQHEVARLAHINPAMMSHIERGRRVPSLRVLTRVAAALELELTFRHTPDGGDVSAGNGRVKGPTEGAR